MKTSLQEAINFDQFPFVVWSLDAHLEGEKIVFGNIHYINDSVKSITGWSNEQINQDPDWWLNHVHPDDVDFVLKQTRLLFKQPSIQFEYRFQNASGDYIWCRDDVYVVERTDKYFKVFGTSKEVTDLKALQSKNSELDRLFNNVIKEVPVGLLIFKDKILHANPAFEKLSGYSEQELLELPVWSLLEPDLQPLFKQKSLQRLNKWLPPSHYTDIPCHTKDSTLRHVELHVSSIEIDGEPAGVLVVTDKTENLKLQKSLKLQSEILDNIYDSIVVFKVADKKIIYTNHIAYQNLGYEKNELIGSKWKTIIAPHCWSDKKSQIALSLEVNKTCTVELEQRTKQGKLILVESNIKVHDWNGQDIAVCVARDISQRKLHEKKIEFSNELYNLHSGINQLLTKVTDREELCRKLSDIIVENSSIDAAWTGLVDHEEKLLTVKHAAGSVSSRFKGTVLPLIYGQKNVDGMEPSGMVNAVLNNDIVYTDKNDCLLQSLSELDLNYCVSIPLRQLDKVVGVLTLCSSQKRFNSPQERALHQDIAQDVHFMLNRFSEQMESQLFFESVKQSPNWMLICDHRGRIEFVNDSVLKTSGYTREELIGQTPDIFKSGKHDNKFYKDFWKSIKNGQPFNAFFTNKNKANEIFILDETVVPIKHCQGHKFVSLGRDISKEMELKRELTYLSFNDPITGMFNRDYLLQELPQILKATVKQQTCLALMVVDIKNFAMINDTYGFETGNEILKKLAKRFKKRVNNDDIVARFGSDEFAILIQDLESIEQAYSIVDSIFSALNKSIKLKGRGENIQVGGDMGVVTFPDGSKTVDELVHNVDLALVKAKKSVGNNISYYEQAMNKEAKSYLTIHNALIKAVKNNSFELHYQPYFDAKTEQFVGFESLVRWRRGDELVYPNHFIDELESSGLILKVEDFIIETVFNHMIVWKSRFNQNQRGSINLSVTNFKHQNLFERIQKLILKTKVNPYHVTFEVVESALVEDKDYAEKVFSQLRELGFKVAIDDFGTGYSSFGYLLDLSADYLKIDISFVRKVKTDDKALAIVEGIINMAHSLDMETIAEGVEDQDTFRLLKVIGCDIVQGYYKARPMPCHEFDQFLIENAPEEGEYSELHSLRDVQ
ncbi:MAG: EAL domain-containing protein [Pseudomonadota bacterium]|nr:EAL domain-containing protein [Pseudomonadota bacterium]